MSRPFYVVDQLAGGYSMLTAPSLSRSEVQEPLQIVLPTALLHHARAENGDVKFLAAGWPEGEHSPVNEFACRLSSSDARIPGVVRTRVNGNCPTSMSREMADVLGLETQALGGMGMEAAVCPTPTPVAILVEPLIIEVLDTAGRAVRTFAAPLVFVCGCSADLFEFQIGTDILERHGLEWSWDGRQGMVGVGGVPIGSAPALFPRPRRANTRGTSTFFVANDTYDEALEVVAARAAVRARRDAARSGEDPAAAAEQAAAAALQQGTSASAARRESRQLALQNRLEPGSAQWVDEWLPAQFRQGGGGGGGRGGGGGGGSGSRRRRGRGRAGRGTTGRGRGGSQGRGLAAEEEEVGEEDEVGEAAGGAASGTATAVAVAHPTAVAVVGTARSTAAVDPAAGLAPLPPGLKARTWAELAATHLPLDDLDCPICFDEMSAKAQLVQLTCRHTYCELCLREQMSRSTTAQGCPLCRQAIVR